MTIDEGLDLAVRGITAAMKRDSASGDGMNVCSITRQNGFQLLSREDVDKRKKKMGLK
jgi:proteasome beta subunit